jgi:hypothetical protein
MSHHDLQSCRSQRLNQRKSSRATANFFNTIGHKQTFALDIRRTTTETGHHPFAYGPEADIPRFKEWTPLR